MESGTAEDVQIPDISMPSAANTSPTSQQISQTSVQIPLISITPPPPLPSSSSSVTTIAEHQASSSIPEWVRLYSPQSSDDVPPFDRSEIYLPDEMADQLNVLLSPYGRAMLSGVRSHVGGIGRAATFYCVPGSGRETAMRAICYYNWIDLYVVTHPSPTAEYFKRLFKYAETKSTRSVIFIRNCEHTLVSSPLVSTTLADEIRRVSDTKHLTDVVTIIAWSDRVTLMPYDLVSVQLYVYWMLPPLTDSRVSIFQTLWKKFYPNSPPITTQLGTERFNELVRFSEDNTPHEITVYMTRVRANAGYSKNYQNMSQICARVQGRPNTTQSSTFIDLPPTQQHFQTALLGFTTREGSTVSVLTPYQPHMKNVDGIVGTHSNITQAPRLVGLINSGILRH